MIIQSTTLDTEAKVKAIYGSNTSWLQHSGYFLRGATSGVVANSSTKTGGNDNAIVVSHKHASGVSFVAFGNYGTQSGSYTPGGNPFSGGPVNYSNFTTNTGEDGTNKNIPNYKSVYIWERTA